MDMSNFIKNRYYSICNIFNSISWEFRRYNVKDWLTLIGAALIVLITIMGLLGLVCFVILWPFALTWAINYLFGTNIPLNFWTWLSIIIISWVWNIIIVKPFLARKNL